MRVVILGYGTAALFCAITLNKLSYSLKKEVKVTIVDNKAFALQHSCGLCYAINGSAELEQLMDNTKPKAEFLQRHKAVSVDFKNKIAIAESLDTKELVELPYDKLIIATGASAFVPFKEIPKGVFKLDSIEDVRNIKDYSKHAREISVLGAGAIGVELSYLLAESLNKRVGLIELKKYCLSQSFDQDMAGYIASFLKDNNVELITGSKITELYKDDRTGCLSGFGLEAVSGKEKNKQVTVGSDMLVVAAGIKPNTGFLKGSNIKLDERGYIIVNDKMQTSVDDAYAIGDCSAAKPFFSEMHSAAKLAVPAYKQGVVCAECIMGQDKSYRGSIGSFSIKLGDFEAAAVGLSSASKDSLVSIKIEARQKPEWIKAAKSKKSEESEKSSHNKDGKIIFKLIADTNSRKIVGAQAVSFGYASASAKIDLVAAAISLNSTLDSFSSIELSYCPVSSKTYDITMQAADMLLRKLSIKNHS